MDVWIQVVFLIYASAVVVLTMACRRVGFGERHAWQGVKDLTAGETPSMDSTPDVSVVIAARNEVKTLPLLIADLRLQDNPAFEVIIVDDYSEDNTHVAAAEAIGNDPRFTLIRATGAGKKAALTQAVAAARGALIVTTDADCRLEPHWIAAMASIFVDPSVMMTFGGVRISGQSRFEQLQSMEFATVVGTTAATAGLGTPTMCSGANLAYRKSAFMTVDGYSGNTNIASGDDIFLMQKIRRAFPRGIRFCAEAGSIVTTAPVPTLAGFVHQRIRWAGKWRSGSDTTTKLLAVFVFGFHLLVILLPWIAMARGIRLRTVLTCLLVKAVAEAIFLRRLHFLLPAGWSWLLFFILQGIYSGYVVMIGIWSQFCSFNWKGRSVKPVAVGSH